jgi:hypothetical protein
MKKPDSAICKNCVAYHGIHTGTLHPEETKRDGECRLLPPRVIDADLQATVYPIVDAKDWCCDFSDTWEDEDIEDEDPENTLPGFPPIP